TNASLVVRRLYARRGALSRADATLAVPEIFSAQRLPAGGTAMRRLKGDMTDDYDASMMRRALEEARKAAACGEAPVGAVIVDADGVVLATAGNAPISTHDPTGHAEIRALRAAATSLGNYRLVGTTMFVTLEPCAMCAGAIAHARIARLVFAAEDVKGGAVVNGPRFFEQPTCHWRPAIERGPYADEASILLRDFFKARR
ncbi:MAG TPA: nucleoside deaminase, partial [Parvularculaceae bacterium]|nr:nucleoside deaminase [Parvularculaceae bacterium]